ncbi:hypothetical protein SELMODRAFT_426482 [Selaginella moellendorffii]|uniref:C17orf113 probable zinc finger domain-containing protein n=1 Tax=Selaginella moellendorffii TaxID=88036 RepID=D8SWI0_SELML|nr:hypothetical protein SELMODRAFT_426482 [Selaginella moellendorffii]
MGVNIDFGGEIIWEMGRVPAGRSKAAAKAIAQSKQSLLSFAPIVERGGFVDEDNLEGTEPEEGCEVGEALIFCSICRANKNCKNPFGTSGSTNMKTSSFHAHGQTKDHKHSIYIAEVKAGGQSSMAAANDQQQEAAEKGVICLFRTAYAIAQGFVPLRKYPLLLELQQLNGVYVPSMYKNVMACSRFITFINKVLLDQILEKVKASPFFGIMLDESTDIR